MEAQAGPEPTAKKRCPDCREVIDRQAKVCPHCRHRFGISLGQVVGAVFVLLLATVVILVLWAYQGHRF